MPRQLLSVDTVADQLRVLGVRPVQVWQVHTAFTKVGPLDGGPLGLIEALRAALGDGGTLVMPSMTDDHCCEHFALVDGWLGERGLQRRGIVGLADAATCARTSGRGRLGGAAAHLTRRPSSIPSAQTRSATTLGQACVSDYCRKSFCHAS